MALLTSKRIPTNNAFCFYYTISVRTFAKRGIYRGRRIKRRMGKPGLPRGDKPRVDESKTRTLTACPWGPPRYPIPRVEQTSVEFAQNINSLADIVQSRIECLGVAVSSYNHASKAAMERMLNYASEIAKSSAYLHLYQLIVVDDILGYSRDIGSRNTLWIPNDFTVKELIKYLKDECINDPKLCEIPRLDCYLNPFQPNNWKSVDNLSKLDGSMSTMNRSQSRRVPMPLNEYREVEPIELLKIREKARNTTYESEHYVDTTDFFNYWSVPSKEEMNKPQGDSDEVPKYVISEESVHNDMESMSYLEQIDEVESKLNAALIKRKEWFLEQTNNNLLQDELEVDDKTIDFEISRISKTKNKGHHLNIIVQKPDKNNSFKQNKDNDLCNIHFPNPSKK